jgi:hypothetical protein
LNLGADSSCLDHQGYSAESRSCKEHRWAAANVFKSHRKASTQRTSNFQLSGRLSLCDDDVFIAGMLFYHLTLAPWKYSSMELVGVLVCLFVVSSLAATVRLREEPFLLML